MNEICVASRHALDWRHFIGASLFVVRHSVDHIFQNTKASFSFSTSQVQDCWAPISIGKIFVVLCFKCPIKDVAQNKTTSYQSMGTMHTKLLNFEFIDDFLCLQDSSNKIKTCFLLKFWVDQFLRLCVLNWTFCKKKGKSVFEIILIGSNDIRRDSRA